MMMRIYCPNNNVPERTYAIEALFSDILGCKHEDYVILFRKDVKNYELCFDDFKLIIEDHFFNHYTEPLSYLNLNHVPAGLDWFHGLGQEIPIIYGEDKFEKKEHTTVIGLDIFASTFFMLTRWEEALLGREENGDCDEAQLFCVKNGIHFRPIVNEYAELLRKLLPPIFNWSSRKYEVVLSHDVDGFIPPSWKRIAKDFVKQSIQGTPKNKVLHLTWIDEIRYKQTFPTAWSQFDLYTKLAEKHDIEEWFYFKVCAKGETEATFEYDSHEVKSIVNTLKKKQNPKIILGFHPSQNTFGNRGQWDKEVKRSKGLLGDTPSIGRNHHLLYNYDILRMWESISEKPMHISNCVFHKRLGFRSGVCVPYHLFDVYQRRVMNLLEHPCQIMDTAIRLHIYKSKDNLWDDIMGIIGYVKRYYGCLLITQHIYVRKTSMVNEYYNLCCELLDAAVKLC